jgi:hypothetical protein
MGTLPLAPGTGVAGFGDASFANRVYSSRLATTAPANATPADCFRNPLRLDWCFIGMAFLYRHYHPGLNPNGLYQIT